LAITLPGRSPIIFQRNAATQEHPAPLLAGCKPIIFSTRRRNDAVPVPPAEQFRMAKLRPPSAGKELLDSRNTRGLVASLRRCVEK
jgi:hypothetical protein